MSRARRRGPGISAEDEARIRKDVELTRKMLKAGSELTDAALPPKKFYPSPCECRICDQQYRLPRLQPDRKQAYDSGSEDLSLASDPDTTMWAIEETLSNIELAYDGLCQMWRVYGKTICARWRKKSRDKREALLRHEDIDLEPKQWKLFDFISELGGSLNWQKARTQRDFWLLPWLTVESLKNDPMRLISLIQNRTEFTPEQWAPFDNANLQFSYNQGFLALHYSPLCIKMSGPDYGTLVEWDKDAAHRLDIIGYPRGQLILEAQERLLTILCNIVHELVDGMEEPGPDCQIVQLPKVEQKRSGRTELWSPYMNQPFSEPPLFDIDFLTSLAQAKVNSYGDHLWLMQTDPAYLRRTIRTAISAIPVRESWDGTALGFRSSHITAITEINMDCGSYSVWVSILEEIQRVANLRRKYLDEIKVGEPLPLEYDIALQALQNFVGQQIETREKALAASIPLRSGFRDHFEFDYSTGEVRWRLKVGAREDSLFDGIFYETHSLYWCISNLYSHPPERLKYQPSLLFAWLDEYLLTAPLEDRRRIDERLYDQLSEYAALNEIETMIHLHRPFCGNLSTPELVKACKNSGSGVFRLSKNEKMMAKIEALENKHSKDFGTTEPLKNFIHAFDHQAEVGKKTDQMRLNHFDEIQAAQDALWTKLLWLHTTAWSYSSISKEEAGIAAVPLSARQDPKFIQALKAERQKLVDKIEESSKPAAKPQADAVQPWQFTSDQKTDASGVKVSGTSTTKIKSRPENSDLSNELESITLSADSEQDVEPPSTPIQVKRQTYIILSSMFTSAETAAAAKKTIEWDAFVNAMVDVGFSARHSSGSAVIFEIDNWDLNWIGKIVFHKPHPVPKIDSVIFRGMGRRMEKWFGWNERTFALKT